MDVSQLPFNRLLGLELANRNNGFLVSLPDDLQYTNHLGTVHAGALLAVAEAGSGAFLSLHFADATGLTPVVRRLEAKFRRPASGQVAARCIVAPDEVNRWSDQLMTRKRISVAIPTEVVDGSGEVVLTTTIEWMITRS